MRRRDLLKLCAALPVVSAVPVVPQGSRGQGHVVYCPADAPWETYSQGQWVPDYRPLGETEYGGG